MTSWGKKHSSAILATALVASKAGLLGKVGLAISAAISAACTGIS